MPELACIVDGHIVHGLRHSHETDANNLVSTASSTRLPEQKETIHTIQMLRKEACSGGIIDLAHVRTEFCLADRLTKAGVKSDMLTEAVRTGALPYCDSQPLFRQGMQHKAYAAPDVRDHWMVEPA